MPDTMPAVIWLKMPPSWAVGPERMVLNVEMALREFRPQARQVKVVFTHWEHFAEMHYEVYCASHPCWTDASDLALYRALDRRIGLQDGDPEWLNLRVFVDECLRNS